VKQIQPETKQTTTIKTKDTKKTLKKLSES